jgi:hypothetical protein
MSQRICFVLSSIGAENSQIRKLADEKFDLIYEPVCDELNYTIQRSDKETSPNLISRDIIARIINSEMVIADVSDLNPNVFYELAVRNAVKKPVVVVKKVNQALPFDIFDKRAISIDMNDNRQWIEARTRLKDYMKSAEADPSASSESILQEFSFKIGSKLEEGKNSESLEIKDLRDEVHSLIELVKIRSIDSEKNAAVNDKSSKQVLDPPKSHISDSVIPPRDYELLMKSLTRKCPDCGDEIFGSVAGKCFRCSMTRKCPDCGDEIFGSVAGKCFRCSMTRKCPDCGHEYVGLTSGNCMECSLKRLRSNTGL